MTLCEIKIEKVTLQQLTKLQIICRETFYDTFFEDNAKEDMDKYLMENFNDLQLSKELNDPKSEFYFAIIDHKVTGYLKINFGKTQTEIKDENGLEIERIYVSKKFHGKKIGQKLYEVALQVAKDKKLDYVWLGVWEKNLRAIKFYEKNGFIEFDKHIFVLGSDEQLDIMMRLKLP
ncbi:MAG: GNAT family N-acetyltransferase [Alcanivoracaceae bacterium]|nr:GNAT family N-acetyltransferase [Alcanivoracaceae bacterium]